MKKLHRILIVAACVLLVASMASPAFATTQVLYRGTRDGYALVGTGHISGNEVRGAFQATCTDELASAHDPEWYSCKITMLIYDENDCIIGVAQSGKGNLEIGVTYTQADGKEICYVAFTYEFDNVALGTYRLYAD